MAGGEPARSHAGPATPVAAGGLRGERQGAIVTDAVEALPTRVDPRNGLPRDALRLSGRAGIGHQPVVSSRSAKSRSASNSVGPRAGDSDGCLSSPAAQRRPDDDGLPRPRRGIEGRRRRHAPSRGQELVEAVPEGDAERHRESLRGMPR
jgi:hypothetical protein